MVSRDVAPVACEGRQLPFHVVLPGPLRSSRGGARENQARRKALDRVGRTSSTKHVTACVLFLLFLSPSAALGAEPRPLRSAPGLATLLKSKESLTKEHFEGYHRRLWVQHSGDEEALTVMVYFPGAGPDPLLLKYKDRSLLWHVNPLAGVSQYNYMPVLAENGKGSTAVSWYGTDPRGIHLRCFDPHGKRLWSTAVSNRGTQPTSINLMFWRNHGWLAGYGGFEDGRLHLFDLDGKRLWAEGGIGLFQRKGGHNPISIIQDSKDSVFVLWYAYGSIKPPHRKNTFQAQRFRHTGEQIWRQAICLGEAPSFALVPPRQIELSTGEDGRVKAKLYKGIVGDAISSVIEYAVQVSQDGHVVVISESGREPAVSNAQQGAAAGRPSITLKHLAYIDMHAADYTTQHPLVCGAGRDFPAGRELAFRQVESKKTVHAVFPAGVTPPDHLDGKFVLHGHFQGIQNMDVYKFKKPEKDYRYFVVSSWEYVK